MNGEARAGLLEREMVAQRFLVTAICEFFDPDEKKVAAVQGYLDAAGFDAVATCWPVFGGIWRQPCEGPDGEAATDWLEDVTLKLRRGKAEDELCQLRARLDERASHAAA